MKTSKEIAKEILSIAISHHNKKIYKNQPLSFPDACCVEEISSVIDDYIKEITIEGLR